MNKFFDGVLPGWAHPLIMGYDKRGADIIQILNAVPSLPSSAGVYYCIYYVRRDRKTGRDRFEVVFHFSVCYNSVKLIPDALLKVKNFRYL